MATLSKPRSSSLNKQRTREEAFESLRTTTGGSRETREASKIASRTYEGIQERRSREGRAGGSLHSSTGHLATKPHPHSSKKPLTDIFVSGASSFTDLSTTRSDHSDIVQAGRPHFTKHSSSENLKTTKTTAFGRHHSMEPLATGRLGKSWPHSNDYESDGGGTLSRSHSQGNIPPFPEGTLQRGSSITTSTESFDVPMRSQSSGTASSQRATSISRLNSKEERNKLGDLEERMGLLANQFLYERQDMFKQIHRACK